MSRTGNVVNDQKGKWASVVCGQNTHFPSSSSSPFKNVYAGRFGRNDSAPGSWVLMR